METRSASRPSHPNDALDWSGRSRSARLARVNKPLRCRPLEGRRDQKSPLRRCFKPRPPLRAGCAGFASGCQSSVRSCDRYDRRVCDPRSWRSCSGRLSGLLSGCPPTDTRPQARAKLGEGASSPYCDPLQELSTTKMKILLHRRGALPRRGTRKRVADKSPGAPARRRGAVSVAAAGRPRTPPIGALWRSPRPRFAADSHFLMRGRAAPPAALRPWPARQHQLPAAIGALFGTPCRPGRPPLRGHDVFGYIRATFRRPA